MEKELAWQEFNKRDQVVTKRKEFNSEEEMIKFIDKLVEKETFYQILASR
jgi:hypothetical protein